MPKNNQCNHFLFLSCILKLKKLADPTRNNPENKTPHVPDHIELIVLTTPPKYFSKSCG